MKCFNAFFEFGEFWMKKPLIIVLLLQFLWACGGSNTPAGDNTLNTSENQATALSTDSSTALANAFCAAQTRLQMVSTSLLSAYSAKGNGSDLNYCGGESALTEDKPNFQIALKDYCVNFRGQQLILNGDIFGATESGSNFTSDISDLALTGKGVDLTINGKSTAGRADDMFITSVVTDNKAGEDIGLENISLKKGEFDFGYFTLPDVGRHEFKFIDYFNAELTQGQLFIYGEGEQLLIISADNGAITAVYKETKLDPGTLLNTSCGG